MKPIFSRNIDYNKIAFLNWRIDDGNDIRNMLNLAEGFLDSSLELARICLSDNEDKKADILIFPILTNANHGIELYLKALIWAYNELLKNGKKIEGNHNIKQLLQTLKSKVSEYNGSMSLKEFNYSVKDLDDYITELFFKIGATPKDNKMDFSRYPISNDYDNHFYVNTIGNVEIDLENFVDVFTNIQNTFETLVDYLFYHELNKDY